ncbi:MAG: class I tRNA ligase family protein, partial [Patescibacteria group bacterium]
MFSSENFKPSEIEEKVLEFWEKNQVFQKSLDKTKGGKPFTFYDGPPFATGFPHYGHILASTIKDVIPRYQTMKGRFVRRRWGWDCHGLPIEEIVERHLGISGKKQIEEIGIKKFNETCREKVLEYADEWRKMVRRIARWIDFDNSYKTMDRDYMESVWWAFKQIYDKGLVYEGRKVLMYCPRCETPVSNFEVAMDNSYKDVEEETVFAKFKIQNSKFETGKHTYFLAWTTTPWTLPGNVALAVGEDIEYVLAKSGNEAYILAKNTAEKVLGSEPNSKFSAEGGSAFGGQILNSMKGSDLVGLEYEPLFDVPAVKNNKTFKVYPADFVSTEEGTGIVHTAVVYGEEDYELGQKVGLPVVPLLDEKGKFNDKAPEFLRGAYFKDADPTIIADLEKRGLLFRKEKQTHSYPHCWRCGTPLFYNAIPAWFINIQKIKKDLIDSNAKEINWYPEHLKFGRYQKSVESAPDWNISRNRYWGNPIPVWKCSKDCPPIVIGSIKELGLSSNAFYFTRHGEARQNVLGINSCYPEKEVYDLTDAGVGRANKLAERLRVQGGIDLIFSSDLLRTKHTADIIGAALGAPVATDERLREYNLGAYNGSKMEDFGQAFPAETRWTNAPEGGETWTQIQERMTGFIKEADKKYQGKKILIVSHGDPLWLVQKYYGSERPYPGYADAFEISMGIDDLHRTYIDEVVLRCPKCGGEARRIKEVFDSWVEAGSMPFAEYHYPFDQKEVFEARLPAQFVAEYIAQTRAWFYLMHVVSYVLFGRAPFENVVTTGTILGEDGFKM